MNKSQSLIKRIKSINESLRINESYSLDQIRSLVKPLHTKLAAVKSQKDYDKFLGECGEFSDLVDKRFNPDSVDSTANNLHYHQRDPEVSEFLYSLRYTNK